MELSPKQQINELIKKNKNVLIVGNKNAGGDLIGSMLALERVLTKLEKEVTIVSSGDIEETLTFLPGIEKIQKDIAGARELIIRIDTNKTPLEKISRSDEEGVVNLILSPKTKSITREDIEFIDGKFKFDLIFVLDTPDIEKIDPIYDRYTELFFETPIINIDHHLGNDYFGTVNMVDLTATSTSEILVSIIESMGISGGSFDADIATCLLTGIISDTASFKNENTTPKSLTISAQMLAAGARQQEIVQHLYKTRSLNTLKLWGKVLSNLQYDKESRITYSGISYTDFTTTKSNPDEIWGVLDELLVNTPGTDVVLLLAENEPDRIQAKIKASSGQSAIAIAEIFRGTGNAKYAEFEMTNIDLEQAIQKVFAKINESKNTQTENQILSETKEEIPPISEAPIPIQEEKDQIIQTTSKTEAKTNQPITITQRAQTEEKSEPKQTDPIAQALKSLSEEIDAGKTEKDKNDRNEVVLPNIDIKESRSQNKSFSSLGETMKKYSPVKPKPTAEIDYEEDDYEEPDDEEMTYDSQTEITGKGEQAIDIRVWKE